VKQKIAITIDRQLLSFIDSQAQGNRSDYLNSLLHRERQMQLKQQMITALTEDLQDPEYLAEIAEWDRLAADGLDA
jgi:Arc/MetJ-type ribon-helix-helix transcriptional regulator